MTNKEIAVALHTANQWSSDQKGNGLAALSLGTTRKVHSEDHRKELISELTADINYCKEVKGGTRDASDDFDADKEIELLTVLVGIIKDVSVGYEWLTDRMYMGCVDRMYESGELG